MTLIVSCSTPEYIIQVSDRRLTRLDGSLYDDESNKAVFYLPSMVLAYTGISRVGSVPTDQWLTENLRPGIDEIAVFAGELAAKLTAALANVPLAYRHLAIIASFWARDPSHDNRPGNCMISNFHGVRPDGKFGALPNASPRFNWWTSIKQPEQRFLMYAAGQALAPSQIRQFQRFIGRYLDKTTPSQRVYGAKGLCRYLAQYIRSLADRNGRIGKSLMETILPNPRLPLLASQSAMFSYRPANQGATAIYAPNFVSSTMNIMGPTFRGDSPTTRCE